MAVQLEFPLVSLAHRDRENFFHLLMDEAISFNSYALIYITIRIFFSPMYTHRGREKNLQRSFELYKLCVLHVTCTVHMYGKYCNPIHTCFSALTSRPTTKLKQTICDGVCIDLGTIFFSYLLYHADTGALDRDVNITMFSNCFKSWKFLLNNAICAKLGLLLM